MIEERLKHEILAYAKAKEPHECCGFVVLNGKQQQFLPCANIADDPENYFEISPDDFLKAESYDSVIALVHSHPNGTPKLSSADRQMQMNSQLDWWLVCEDEIYFFPVIPPLLGRDFQHGISDCYSLVRDFYQLSGLDLPNFERTDYWWEQGENLYLDHMTEQGFEQLDESAIVLPGDLILMQVGADVPNHAAVYLGNQMVLHHSPKRLSKRDNYDGYWLKHTHSIWRHKQWLQLDFTVALNSLA